MSTAEDFLDDMRDRLDDEGDTKFSLAMKLRFLNRGQAAMYPRVYRTVRDSTLVIAADTFEYNVPSAVGSNSKILTLEIEDAAGRLFPLERYMIIPGLTDPILQLKGSALPGPVGANIRITAIAPLTPFVDANSTYTGPPVTEELPVIYAVSLCMARDVESRMNYRRMPTVENMNGITAEDLMTSSQFWMGQFELLLERLQMPLPAAGF